MVCLGWLGERGKTQYDISIQRVVCSLYNLRQSRPTVELAHLFSSSVHLLDVVGNPVNEAPNPMGLAFCLSDS